MPLLSTRIGPCRDWTTFAGNSGASSFFGAAAGSSCASAPFTDSNNAAAIIANLSILPSNKGKSRVNAPTVAHDTRGKLAGRCADGGGRHDARSRLHRETRAAGEGSEAISARGAPA